MTLTKRKFILAAVCAAVLGLSACGGTGEPAQLPAASVQTSSTAWSFGVIGDTQWTLATDPAGTNPNGVSASIISQINKQFISKGVKFVVQVGDLTESGNDADVATRAAAAQALYDAGIGFFSAAWQPRNLRQPDQWFWSCSIQIQFPANTVHQQDVWCHQLQQPDFSQQRSHRHELFV